MANALYDPLSQRDPRWAGVQLGHGQLTIGQAGCFITAAAMIARHYGHQVTPLDINAQLIARGLYAGAERNLWPDDGLSKLFGIQLERRWDSPSTPADLTTLAMTDEEERLIVIHRPRMGFDTHALRVFDWPVVDDPWWGDRVNFTSRYGADATVAITAVVGYRVAGFIPPWKLPAPADQAAQLAALTAERDQLRKQLAASSALVKAAALVGREILAAGGQ